MDNRFTSQPQAVQNGGMFSRDKIHQISRKLMQIYATNQQDELQPQDLARCMIDTYRGMNKHFIPTGYQLSSFAKVFDRSKKGKITYEDVVATANRMFLASNKNTQGSQNTQALRPF